VEAKTQEPQNQKHNENRPKHVYLLHSFVELLILSPSPYPYPYPCLASLRASWTSLNDFPHAKQNGLDREVISPQNGHTLVDPK